MSQHCIFVWQVWQLCLFVLQQICDPQDPQYGGRDEADERSAGQVLLGGQGAGGGGEQGRPFIIPSALRPSSSRSLRPLPLSLPL